MKLHSHADDGLDLMIGVMMNDWNAEQYSKFLQQRTRPASDLLAHIAHHQARFITDLGCGPANSTELLYKKWSDAHIIGVDSSPDMIKTAQDRLPQATFIQADFHQWQADTPQDVIFANASLQWSPNQREMLPRLVANLADGGVLAVQMPDNLNEPSHRLMRDVAKHPKWRVKLSDVAVRPVMLGVDDYYGVLTQAGCGVDIWRTTYYHVLPSVASIAQWFGSTAMRPYLQALDQDEQAQFLQRYIQALSQAYQVQADGQVLLRLPRLFIVATKHTH